MASVASQRYSQSKLVRIFGVFMSHKAHRTCFQKDLIGGLEESKSHDESDLPLQMNWFTRIPVTLADVTWLVHDYGDSGIILKTRTYADCDCIFPWDEQQSTFMNGPYSRRRLTNAASVYRAELLPFNSTPVIPNRLSSSKSSCQCQLFKENYENSYLTKHGSNSCSLPESGYQTPCDSECGRSSGTMTPFYESDDKGFNTTDPAARQKISDLEMELNRVKQQLAVLVLSQEQMVQNNWKPGESMQLNKNTDFSSRPNVPPPPPPHPPPCVPAPPPPPPPPPPPMMGCTNKKSITDIINETKKKKGLSLTPKTPKQGPDMSAVLKDLGKVKLKSVKRSPGGTPIRERPKSAEKHDPAAVIAKALQRKFAHRYMASPEKSGNTNNASPNSRDNSWTSTPPGPHLLKATQLRTRLVEGKHS